MAEVAASDDPGAKKPKADVAPCRLILGSASKWRRQLFGKHFPERMATASFVAADIDEKAIRHPDASVMTCLIAGAKANALLPQFSSESALLICMDQVVRCNGEIREKPEDASQARTFLRSYAEGHAAECINGVVIVNTSTGLRFCGNELASVQYGKFSEEAIDRIIARGEVLGSAGSFVIEDEDLQAHQTGLVGTEDAIEGLPLATLNDLMRRAVEPIKITHCIFDMDGLLLDTESAYTEAQQEIVGRFGKQFTWDLKAKMMGKKSLEAAEILVAELELEGKLDPQDFLKEREVLLESKFRNSRVLPGVERLLRHLKSCGIQAAVATGSTRPQFELKTSQHKDLFAECFVHIVTGDNVERGKPDPDIFFKAAESFQGGAPSSDSILVFEDAPNGVEAALKAGMRVVMVPDSNLSHASRGMAHQELSTLEDFDPSLWGLPPFN